MNLKFKNWNNNRNLELLFIDLLITFFSGYIAFYLEFDNGGVSDILPNFSILSFDIVITLICYFIGFLIFRTFGSFGRNHSYEDFGYTVGGLLTGLFLSLGCLYGIFGGVIPELLDSHDLILQFLLTLIGIRASRSLIRLHYQYYSRRSDHNGSYGLSDMALLNMEMSDFLPRPKIEIDRKVISNEIQGKCIMVTGAAGSIGSELVRKIATYSPALLIIIDQAETPLHDLELALKRNHPELKFISILSDINNNLIISEVFDAHKPDIIFHAAAYKHVSMMEQNPVECIINNVGGTITIANLAVKHNCEKFILISTDKAVNPTGVMGCSKRICEIYCQSLSESPEWNSICAFVTTRFGNVLGSNGSVVPVFREQIRHGGPITLTHPEVIRYFMLIEEACDLVLEASALGKGGEIYVFDMGVPVKILELAKKMIKISRRRDIKIEYTGLLPGEKLYEEVLADKEKIISSVKDGIQVAKVRKYDFEKVKVEINKLLEAAHANNPKLVLELMHEIVPEYKERPVKTVSKVS